MRNECCPVFAFVLSLELSLFLSVPFSLTKLARQVDPLLLKLSHSPFLHILSVLPRSTFADMGSPRTNVLRLPFGSSTFLDFYFQLGFFLFNLRPARAFFDFPLRGSLLVTQCGRRREDRSFRIFFFIFPS